MSEQNGAHTLQAELERMNAAIESYALQLDTINSAIESIDSENHSDDVSRQIFEYQTACERDPANISAEDALDTVTRLENTLKIVRRRNQLLAKENVTQQKLLNDRSKFLLKETKNYENLVDRTGWHEQCSVNPEDEAQKASDIQEMSQLEVTVQRELRAAHTILKKKEALLRGLEEQLAKGTDLDAELNNAYNDIRVRKRECRELELRLEHLRKCSKKNDEALTVFENHGQSVSIEYMETDKDFLKDAVAQMKLVCRRQDNVIRAQLTRQQQLQTRLDTILRSLREMNLEKEYERNVSKSALVPSASREEPEDVSSILPKEETIPIHTYRLIFKNKELMNTNVVRKNMLVLEKEGVIQALEASLMKYANALNMTTRQLENMKLNKGFEMTELMVELQQQHKNYLQQLEQIMQENNKLKKQLYRTPQLRTLIKNR
ncbi:hypothetical protein TCSYLVIO_005781 [Trypanosoma cruzi]|uniref:DUF4201 domain-containing protein n=2 Tax=Trypanosoma cruzi TaxID=5693 RepID=V5BXZ9_TRYCR|nr:hypothetical protein TCSYLVIO_005781 [Trypanosoma cruzi]ESS71092.1 hypothetical protein TCDM_00116 [Trypanosoma cruzi Dm28c]PBJ73273.1 hypothetical protein BCY84_14146 [Trypanosoma cruzi cruzi]KAF8289611.1 hypothetical protein TcBrA4_0139890 [Trypanosoma cruzi]PWV02508.1 hypothetical protein C4B63_2g700 [Trypanosoma cruzi]